jgi:hypothetical protein
LKISKERAGIEVAVDAEQLRKALAPAADGAKSA